jgi:hypothetical protein
MEVTRLRSFDGCATECLNAHKACLSALEYCLNQGGKFAEPGHIRLLRVCAEVSRTSAFVLLTHSTFHMSTCDVCAEVCEACAESCDYLEDEKMNVCADILRECSDSCTAMTMHEAA